MDAYSTISKINPHNLVITMRASDFCDLFDGRLTSEDKKNLLNEVAKRIQNAVNNHQSMEDALRNMLGTFDTPLTILKMGESWTSFHDEAVKSARDAVNNGNPLYAP